jgi:hypothetical protein
MYYKHPELPLIDMTQKIWHYYTLPKFLSLLSSSSIYMCRQDKFDDSFEGAMTKKDEAFFESKAAGITKGMKGDSLGCTYSNCWTKSDVDEYVLWSSYASLKDGVAIQSTVLKLITALDSEDKRLVYVSDVQYIDYNTQYSFQLTGNIANMIAPHFSKRPYFEAEKELRAMYWDTDGRFSNTPEGLLFKVDLNELIESVYVAPQSYPQYRELIEELLHKYGLQKEVKRSGI